MKPRRALAALIVIAAVIVCAPRAQAMPASPHPIVVHQPDGTALTLRLLGDEHYSWWQDMAGHPVIVANGEYRYASHDAAGELVATPYRVGTVDPASVGISVGHRPSPAVQTRIRQLRQQSMAPAPDAGPITPPNGTVRNLVVLAQFSDHSAAKTRPASEYTTLFNTLGGDPTIAPSGSVRDVWKENSYNTLDLVSTVQNWVTLPQTEAFYADHTQGGTPAKRNQMVTDALAILDGTVNFADFDGNNDGYVDAIDVIHSGYGAEATGDSDMVWSRAFTLGSDWTSADKNANGIFVKVSRVHTEPALWDTAGTAIVRIGVIAHETGHFFGLPDLYDYDYDGQGVGGWCLMGDSWGWNGDQRYPPQLCAWSKKQLGYVVPAVLTSPGAQSISQAETNAAAYRINIGYTTNEYLLIENRQPTGFDREIPHGGIAIWHIDDNLSHTAGDPFNQYQGFPGQPGWPGNGQHYGVALLQADGEYDLEKNNWSDFVHGDDTDLWRLDGRLLLNEATTPSSDRYATFTNPTGNEIKVTTVSQQTMAFEYRPSVWVDFAYGGLYYGTFDNPYNTLGSATAAAPNDWAIVCKGGTTFEHPTLTKPLVYRSWSAPTTIGP
ncbi:MAG TPA: M6 family metalloprotease domain-containing protein [Candidatus Eisenbacteria bacterium]|nr:M6 family metalloprotease domain-containing protein [Candidatus Eisenbacteria bacterium]